MNDQDQSPPTQDGGRFILVEAASQFLEDRALGLGAGLAYYGLATLVPIGALVIGLLGLVLGEEAVDGQLVERLDGRVSDDVASALETALVEAEAAASFTNLTIFSVVALVFTASVLFVAWRDALDVIWGVGYQGGVKSTLIGRLLGVAAVGVLAAVVIVAFVVEALLGMLAGLFSDDVVIDTAYRATTAVAPLLVSFLLLSALYRFGTNNAASWRAIWRGSALTLVLLLLVNWAYGVYLDVVGTSLVSVASSAIILILLVYLTAQVLLYGAEFIKVWQRRHEA